MSLFLYRLLSNQWEDLYALQIITYYAVERSPEGEHGPGQFVWETHLFSTESTQNVTHSASSAGSDGN